MPNGISLTNLFSNNKFAEAKMITDSSGKRMKRISAFKINAKIKAVIINIAVSVNFCINNILS